MASHYMYVLECADGSLYTGYAVDVQARLAVHDAMHAEYVFKQLSRNEKDALLAVASHSSFEEALEELLG